MSRHIDHGAQLFPCCREISSTLFGPNRVADLTKDEGLRHRLADIHAKFEVLNEHYDPSDGPLAAALNQPLPEGWFLALRSCGDALLKALSLYPSIGDALSSTASILRELISGPSPTQLQHKAPPSFTQLPRLQTHQNDDELLWCVKKLEESLENLHPLNLWWSSDDAMKPSNTPFVGVPTSGISKFVFREKHFETLDNAFQPPNRSTQGAVCVLTGPKGSGKTETALQYAVRRKNEFPGGIFWVADNNVFADTAKLLSFIMGNKAGHPHIGTCGILRSFFETTTDCLIIYDEMEPRATGGNDRLAMFVGLGMKAALIITSTTVPSIISEFKCPTHILQVGDLPEKDAVDHFLFLLNRKKPGYPADPKDVGQILGSISRSPRALERATDYLSRASTPISEYARRLQGSGQPRVKQVKVTQCEDIGGGPSLLIRVEPRDSIAKEIHRSYEQLIDLDSELNDLFGLFIETKHGADCRLSQPYDSQSGLDRADRFLQMVIQLPETSRSEPLEKFLGLRQGPIPTGSMACVSETYPGRGRSLLAGSQVEADPRHTSFTPTVNPEFPDPPNFWTVPEPLGINSPDGGPLQGGQRFRVAGDSKTIRVPEPHTDSEPIQNPRSSKGHFDAGKSIHRTGGHTRSGRYCVSFRRKLESLLLCHTEPERGGVLTTVTSKLRSRFTGLNTPG